MEHSALLIGLYAVASIIAFVLYAFDKSAARQSRRRIPEATLHLWSLLGGWPGALAAQQVFRHKTRKLSFQIVFWLTVLVNSAALAWALATSRAESPRDSPPPSNLPTITPRSRSRDDR
jgi:uncharacterized membrane protein YsdA (DUF1294 family)